ncbi:GNAT family N-acetyltransferase [Mangrovibacterium diazotrophicum]|uniref:Acetyltransferase (GNAT) family protein n=1 Tax=Mangrovibacterium diazotrophicum TaxID=1261403 RepID=A0A419WBN5_9BACT|nr:GNAT family N-acetyltransferase [Mangrovibacterium diazotrophicum]RKD92873.1 acetyltransferase (GNAT) family protein [Mangrovibacterium diazotrophicum]
MHLTFVEIDLENQEHVDALIVLLDCYMQDPMGISDPMPEGLAPKIISGLREYPGYLGFLVKAGDRYAALANCNRNFSTFKAKYLINIHDFIVHPDFRGQGVGQFLLDEIASYGERNGYCRVNLEVRHDNENAQKLYIKAGFVECNPPMYFWERVW